MAEDSIWIVWIQLNVNLLINWSVASDPCRRIPDYCLLKIFTSFFPQVSVIRSELAGRQLLKTREKHTSTAALLKYRGKQWHLIRFIPVMTGVENSCPFHWLLLLLMRCLQRKKGEFKRFWHSIFLRIQARSFNSMSSECHMEQSRDRS